MTTFDAFKFQRYNALFTSNHVKQFLAAAAYYGMPYRQLRRAAPLDDFSVVSPV